jgi:hypothetical protein
MRSSESRVTSATRFSTDRSITAIGSNRESVRTVSGMAAPVALVVHFGLIYAKTGNLPAVDVSGVPRSGGADAPFESILTSCVTVS